MRQGHGRGLERRDVDKYRGEGIGRGREGKKCLER